MHLTGSNTINAPRGEVFDFLTNPDLVSKCAPGLENIEVVEPNKRFKATGSVGLGNLKVNFSGDLEFVELDPPNMAKIKGHGTAPGSAADVVAEMRLKDGEGETTIMEWAADVNIMGTIASLASRMMGSVTQKLSSQFFDCVKVQIEK